MAEAAQRAANERARAAEEIAKFKELLEDARASKRELVEQLELGKLEADEAAKMLVDLKQSLEDAEVEKELVSQNSAVAMQLRDLGFRRRSNWTFCKPSLSRRLHSVKSCDRA